MEAVLDFSESRRLVGSPFPAIVGKGMLLAAELRTRRWDAALTRVRAEQERTLLAITRHARGTAFGSKLDFTGVRNYESYRVRVPIGDYDSFSPYIERMRQGERNLLVPEFVRYYGNSSGSSTQGRPKFLPISERQIADQQQSGADALMRTLAWLKDDEFSRGFTLGLFPPTTMKAEGPVLVTSNPALMVTKLPLLARPAYLPDDECREIADYDEKLTRIARQYLDHDVRALAGTTCWFGALFERVLTEARKSGRRVSTVQEVWPNLRILLGGGVSAEPYLPVLRTLLGRPDFLLVDSYNATEGGLYAVSDQRDEPGMLMIPHRGTFFEFIPLAEHDQPAPRRIPLWEVSLDVPYAIVVTTLSGLYSYKLGDIVRFPRKNRVEFVGRLSGCLSVTQELTTHVEIERAVAHAVSEVPCTTLDFGASADVGTKSRYLLFVEFAAGKGPADLAAFARAFDAGLCRENRVYREHRRDDVAILPPRIVPLRQGGAQSYLSLITRGNVQGKFPRIIDPQRKDRIGDFAEPQ
jgi:GH3 auxin-responsive promoter